MKYSGEPQRLPVLPAILVHEIYALILCFWMTYQRL